MNLTKNWYLSMNHRLFVSAVIVWQSLILESQGRSEGFSEVHQASEPTPWVDYKTQDPILLASTFGKSSEETTTPSQKQVSQNNPEKESLSSKQALYPYRWENGLDLLLTNLFGKSATKLESPSLIGEALWSYKFRSGTYLGGVLLGSLQSMAVTRDAAKLAFTLYHFGPYIGQDLWRFEHYRIIASLSFGKGFLFVRRTPASGKQSMHRNEYQFFEPGLTAILYQTQTFDIGLVTHYRSVNLEEPIVANQINPENPDGTTTPITVATDQDIKGLSFGVTFRSTRF